MEYTSSAQNQNRVLFALNKNLCKLAFIQKTLIRDEMKGCETLRNVVMLFKYTYIILLLY